MLLYGSIPFGGDNTDQMYLLGFFKHELHIRSSLAIQLIRLKVLFLTSVVQKWVVGETTFPTRDAVFSFQFST